MATRLNPYLNFAGDGRQAMEFYQAVFGGELTLMTFGEFGMADSPIADQVMHAMLETPAGFTLMASDVPPDMERNPGDTISVSVSGDDEAALRGYWEKLSDGATITMPLDTQMWGDVFGSCVDRFGVPWMINIAQPT